MSLVDGRNPGWPDELCGQLEAGTNYFLILPNVPGFFEELAKTLQLDPEHLPKPINRHRLFSLGPFIQSNDSDRMLQAQEQGHPVFFIEQLDLPINRPPRVKPFIVYCPIRGIISQHDSQREARASFDDYKEAMAGLRNHATPADVYKWRGSEWVNTETC